MLFYFWTEVLASEDTLKANATLELCSFGCLFQLSRLAKYGTNNRAMICILNAKVDYRILCMALLHSQTRCQRIKIVLTPSGMYRVDKRQSQLESFGCDVL